MVHIHGRNYNRSRLYAYLTTDLTPEQLTAIHVEFELGSQEKDVPFEELFIKDIKEYRGKSHADIRRAENDAGRTGPFLLIDDNAVEKQALWYISEFASEEEVESGAADSTKALWKILMKTVCVSFFYAGYEFGDLTMGDDLRDLGLDGVVLTEDFKKTHVLDFEVDLKESIAFTPITVTAEPGEFEESTDETLRHNIRPVPDKVARLKTDVARAAGLSTTWKTPFPAKSLDMPDGSIKTFPEGSIVLQLRYDWSGHERPRHRPEGSL